MLVRPAYGSRCWELDALSPTILREPVERRFVERLDLERGTTPIEIEAAERESVYRLPRPVSRHFWAGIEIRRGRAMTAPRWQVEIIHPVDRKAKLWDHYPTHQRAQEIAHMLLRHGIHAVVRRIDGEVEEPEHCGDRRRFLVWAVLCGFAPPERLADRIVADVEAES